MRSSEKPAERCKHSLCCYVTRCVASRNPDKLGDTPACCPRHPASVSSVPASLAQAVRAVETLNGTDLGGRKILVREDREDKDVKNYNRCACLSPPTARSCAVHPVIAKRQLGVPAVAHASLNTV